MFQHFKSEINESAYPIEKFFDFLFSKKKELKIKIKMKNLKL